MRFTTFGVTLLSCSSLFVACNRERTQDSMAPEGVSAAPRPLGIEDTTPNRAGGAVAPKPSNLGEPTGVTGNASGGAGGTTAAAGGAGAAGGAKQR